MRFFFQYLKDHIRPMVLFLLCVCIFAAAFALYHLPLAAVLYPACLCAAVILCFCVVGACRRMKKHRALQQLQALPENLSEVKGELTSQETDGWYTLTNTASSRI